MVKERTHILSRVQKLLNLASRAGTEGEAIAAMGAAQKLIEEHNFSDSELKEKDGEEFSLNPSIILGVMKRWPGWLTTLAFGISASLDCRAIITRKRLPNGKTECVYGVGGAPEDAELVFVMFGYIKSQINKFGAFYKLDGHGAREVNAYKLGMSQKVLQLMKEEKAKASENVPGLVVRSTKLSRFDAWARMNHGMVSTKKSISTRNQESMRDGNRDGDKIGRGNKSRLRRGQLAIGEG